MSTKPGLMILSLQSIVRTPSGVAMSSAISAIVPSLTRISFSTLSTWSFVPCRRTTPPLSSSEDVVRVMAECQSSTLSRRV